MKPIICVVIATILFTTSEAKALFGHVAAEKNRREHAEQQLTQQEQTNSSLHVTISILSAGVITALIIGAAAGSKTKKDHET